jgi:hypothetical protein
MGGKLRLRLREYASAIMRTGMMRDDRLHEQIGHRFRPCQLIFPRRSKTLKAASQCLATSTKKPGDFSPGFPIEAKV